MHDVTVVGGGVVGLSIARELATTGASVLVLDKGAAADAASWAAAGMLAPQSEAVVPNAFFNLCMSSLRFYRSWVEQLKEESGVDPEYSESGLLFLASTEKALCELKQRAEWQQAAGLTAELIPPEQVHRLEPRLTLPLSGAVLMPNEHHVTPRLLLESLRGACATRGVEIREGEQVHEVLSDGGRATGVKTSSGVILSRWVIIATGVRSADIGGLKPSIPVTPRKGQILSLMTTPSTFKMIVRWDHIYLVPRPSGELIVGATNEDAGFDRSITPAGVGGLLTSAQQLSSSIADYPIREMWAGLRPATPDGLPVIGKAAVDGLIYATGHYRNGVLLAPITASSVAALVQNQQPSVPLEHYSPSRFAV